MIEEIIKNRKQYSKTPIYGIQINKGGCGIEITINDLPYFNMMTPGGFSSYMSLNNRILKSGNQKINLKIYPGSGKEVLDEYTYTDLDISLSPEKTTPIDDFIPIFQFRLPDEIKKQGAPFFQTEILFKAEVPYDYSKQLEGAIRLNNGNFNTQKIIKKFEEVRQILINKDIAAWNAMHISRETRASTVNYLSSDEIKRRSDNADLFNSDAVVMPISNDYEIVYYADGKIVTLLSSQDRESALRVKVKDPDLGEGEATLNLLLYQPRGSNELMIY